MTQSSVKAATSRDVARLAGVSQATVSRVLHDSPRVEPATREAVLSAIAQLDYQPNLAARSMRTRRTNTIALVVASLSVNPLFPAMLQVLWGTLRKHGLLATIWEADQFTAETARALTESSVDAVIVATAIDAATPWLSRVAERKPVVLINRTVSSTGFDQVSSDNLGGGRAVAAYFCDAGRRRIGMVASQGNPASTIQDREAGFQAELLRRGVRLDERSVARVPESSYAAGFSAAQALTDLDAIFCINDITAIGVLDGLRAAGRDVPGQTWLVGYDDIPMCAWACVGMSTVRQPLESMAETAVEILVARLDGDTDAARQVVLPNQILHRTTTATG